MLSDRFFSSLFLSFLLCFSFTFFSGNDSKHFPSGTGCRKSAGFLFLFLKKICAKDLVLMQHMRSQSRPLPTGSPLQGFRLPRKNGGSKSVARMRCCNLWVSVSAFIFKYISEEEFLIGDFALRCSDKSAREPNRVLSLRNQPFLQLFLSPAVLAPKRSVKRTHSDTV